MAKAAHKAYSLVKERILSGEYPPAMRITEQEIADASGVSRTPVREALQRLQSEGLVRVAANQGAVVVDWNDDDATDVFELRALLEPYGAARAATRIDAAGIQRLRALAEAQYEESEAREPGYTERIGLNPLRTMARGVFGKNSTDIIIPREVARQLLAVEENHRLLLEGRVLVVLNGK